MTRLLAAAVLVACLVPAVLVGRASAKPRTVSIAWVGDIAMVASSDGGAGFFSSSIRHELRGDVVIGNLEGTLATGGYSKCGPSSTDCFAFRAPPSYARLLRQAGFTLDERRQQPRVRLRLGGTARDAGRAPLERPAYGGAPRADHGRPGPRASGSPWIGFAPYPWAQSLTNIAAARRIVERGQVRRPISSSCSCTPGGTRAPTSQHVRRGHGTGFLGENRGNLEGVHARGWSTRAPISSWARGRTSLRGMEWYHGRLIAYSLGNFLGDGTLGIGGVLGASGILHVTLAANGAWALAI